MVLWVSTKTGKHVVSDVSVVTLILLAEPGKGPENEVAVSVPSTSASPVTFNFLPVCE